MARRQRKPVVVLLTADEFDLLEAVAAEHERDPYQHVRWLVRQALGVAPSEPMAPEPEAIAI